MKIREFYITIGQNYEEVLTRAMNSEEFLLMLLQSFETDETFALLQTAVEGGQAKEIFDHAHTLKGLALNLGLKPLYEAAALLVEITRNGETKGAQEAFDGVGAAYREIRSLLQTVEHTEEA